MTQDLEDLDKRQQLLLNMEDVIEERIEIDKRACADLDRDWEELYDGVCESCGRVYEQAYLVSLDYQSVSSGYPPEKGDCIPCWRKKNDLPKVDRDESEEVGG